VDHCDELGHQRNFATDWTVCGTFPASGKIHRWITAMNPAISAIIVASKVNPQSGPLPEPSAGAGLV
jgi:hypothetical protein